MGIRKFSEADRPRLHQIMQLCFEGVELPDPGMFNTMLNTSDVWVYEHPANTIVGFVIMNFSSWWEEHIPYLWVMAVDPAHRGQGFASHLLQFVMDYYLNIGEWKSMSLHTRTNNHAAIGLYNKHGFESTLFCPGYYGAGQDGMLMRRRL